MLRKKQQKTLSHSISTVAKKYKDEDIRKWCQENDLNATEFEVRSHKERFRTVSVKTATGMQMVDCRSERTSFMPK